MISPTWAYLERDRYGRLLRYVFADDLHVNVEMVRLGWTPFWTRYGRGRYAEEFERAEAEARAAGCGLWSEETCLPTGSNDKALRTKRVGEKMITRAEWGVDGAHHQGKGSRR